MQRLFTGLMLSLIFCGVVATADDAPKPKGVNHEGDDLRKHDLTVKKEDYRYSNFIDANLSEAKCVGLDFTGAVFTDANLEFARFDEADLTKANLQDTLLTGTSFRKAKMSGVNLLGAKTFDASNVETLRGANLKNAEIKGSLENGDLREADLRGADMTGVYFFPGAKFKKAIYSTQTKFMKGFDPKAAEMILKPQDDEPESASAPDKDDSKKN